MEFNDLKLGTIIEYKFNCMVKYAVVIGISDYCKYEDKFVKEDAYGDILIYAYKLTSITLPEYVEIKSFNSSIYRQQALNKKLTAMLKKELNPNLLERYALKLVNKVDMKPRTKEIQTWLMKNKLFHPSVFDGIFDVEDRKKRLNQIIAKRDNYYKFLWKKLSCYDNIDNSLERNFDKLKFGEIYVSKDYFCICITVQKNLFYCIERKGNLKNEITSFVLTSMPDEIIFGCRKMSPNLLYDTGANIMDYGWNKENYEWIKEYNQNR